MASSQQVNALNALTPIGPQLRHGATYCETKYGSNVNKKEVLEKSKSYLSQCLLNLSNNVLEAMKEVDVLLSQNDASVHALKCTVSELGIKMKHCRSQAVAKIYSENKIPAFKTKKLEQLNNKKANFGISREAFEYSHVAQVGLQVDDILRTAMDIQVEQGSKIQEKGQTDYTIHSGKSKPKDDMTKLSIKQAPVRVEGQTSGQQISKREATPKVSPTLTSQASKSKVSERAAPPPTPPSSSYSTSNNTRTQQPTTRKEPAMPSAVKYSTPPASKEVPPPPPPPAASAKSPPPRPPPSPTGRGAPAPPPPPPPASSSASGRGAPAPPPPPPPASSSASGRGGPAPPPPPPPSSSASARGAPPPPPPPSSSASARGAPPPPPPPSSSSGKGPPPPPSPSPPSKALRPPPLKSARGKGKPFPAPKLSLGSEIAMRKQKLKSSSSPRPDSKPKKAPPPMSMADELANKLKKRRKPTST